MPVVAGSSQGTQPSSLSIGYTKTSLLEIANKWTERKGKTLDLNAEYMTAVQDVCSETRWWWRRKRFTFPTVAGTQSYDLTDSSVVGQGKEVIDFEKFLRDGARLYLSQSDYNCLSPVFEETQQDQLLQYPNPNQRPSQYFIVPGTLCTVAFDSTPDGVYTFVGSYWAIPAYAPDSNQEAIPLIPPYLHHLLLRRLKLNIFRFTQGQNSKEFLTAQGEYNEAVKKAKMTRDFADGRVVDWSNQDGDAIQSTSDIGFPLGTRANT